MIKLSAVWMTGWQLRSVTRTVTLRCGKVIYVCPVESFSSPIGDPADDDRPHRRSHLDHTIVGDRLSTPGAQRSANIDRCSREIVCQKGAQVKPPLEWNPPL